MSYHLIDFNNNIEFDYDNILIGKKISNDEDTSKYYMYYVIDSPKELYIKLPKIRYIYNLVNYKYNQLNIPLYPLWDKLSKFLKFIKELETNIFSVFENKISNCEMTNLIYKKNQISFMKINVFEKFKLYSNNKEITFNDIKINSEIEVIVKISFIWNKNNKIGLSCNLIQINNITSPEYFNNHTPNHTLECFNNSKNINPTKNIPTNNNLPTKNISRFVPSVNDLTNALLKIKK
jgi:hypothetical protein